MTTVRFAYDYKQKRDYESLLESKKEWFGFMRSYKVKSNNNCVMIEP